MFTTLLSGTAIISISQRALLNPHAGTSLAVQWLRLCAPNAESTGSISGRGSKILHAARHSQKKIW